MELPAAINWVNPAFTKQRHTGTANGKNLLDGQLQSKQHNPGPQDALETERHSSLRHLGSADQVADGHADQNGEDQRAERAYPRHFPENEGHSGNTSRKQHSRQNRPHEEGIFYSFDSGKRERIRHDMRTQTMIFSNRLIGVTV